MYRILIPVGLAACALVLSACAGASPPGDAPTTAAPADPSAALRDTFTAYVASINAWDRADESTLDRTLALVTPDWAQFERGEFRAPSSTTGAAWSVASAGPVEGHADEPALGVCLDTGDGTPRPLVAFFETAADAPHGWKLAMLMPADDHVVCTAGEQGG